MPSTVISSFDYNPEKMDLTIKFVTGLMYVYHNVPPDIYAQFQAFREKGIFFNKNIKGKYSFTKAPGSK